MPARVNILDTDGEPLLVPELTDLRITAQLVDPLGAGIPAAQLTTLKLTLHADNATQALINGVDHISILNAGRGTIDATGHLALALQPNDNPILDDTLLEEWHVALVEWTYNAGQSAGRQSLAYRVRNLARVL
jgi:hypothetical protein